MRRAPVGLAAPVVQVGSQLLLVPLVLAAPVVQGESTTQVLPLPCPVPLVLPLLLLLLFALLYSVLVLGPLLAPPPPPEALEEEGLQAAERQHSQKIRSRAVLAHVQKTSQTSERKTKRKRQTDKTSQHSAHNVSASPVSTHLLILDLLHPHVVANHPCSNPLVGSDLDAQHYSKDLLHHVVVLPNYTVLACGVM